jgi:imidazolonepropionase-like amidohydrolase
MFQQRIEARIARLIALVAFVGFSSVGGAQRTGASKTTENARNTVEAGRFELRLFEAPAGAETYRVVRQGKSLVMTSAFQYSDRGAQVTLGSKMRMRSDYTPEELEVKGTDADYFLRVEHGLATVREGNRSRRHEVPERFYTVPGYAPVSVHMMLLRYWTRHTVTGSIPTLFGSEVQVEHRGADKVKLGGKDVELQRYAVTGIIWGREWLWVDPSRQLVAAMTFSPGLNPIHASRQGFDTVMPALLASATSDGARELARVVQRTSPTHKPVLAIVGASLIDGSGSALVRDAAVVVRGDRIVAAGPRGSVSIPEGAEVVDASGKTILPGLWDMHAHHDQVEWGPAYLAAGVTTVRDCGNLVDVKLALREAVESGKAIGPRLLLAGLIDGKGADAIGPIRVDSPAEALAAVERFKRQRFDQIKIYNFLKPDLLRIITAEAHRLGMTVTGHVPQGMNAFEAVEAGMDQINHFGFIPVVMLSDAEKARLEKASAGDFLLTLSSITNAVRLDSIEARRAMTFFKEHGTVLDPTFAGFEVQVHNQGESIEPFEPGIARVPPELAFQINLMGLPADRAGIHQQAFASGLSILGALHKAGVRIVAGTDQMVPGHSLYRELELYVKAGFTPMEAIRAATIVPAQTMNLQSETGSIEPGKRADIILLNGNPIENIANIRKVSAVIARGRFYDCKVLWHSVGFKN